MPFIVISKKPIKTGLVPPSSTIYLFGNENMPGMPCTPEMHYVTLSTKDSTGTVKSKSEWSKEIKSDVEDFEF